MDPEVLSPENSLRALAILCAIPVVIFALWADYFGNHLEALEKEKPDYEREVEHEKIRIAGILGLLLQFMLFLSSAELREQFPLLVNLIFILSVVFHLSIQSNLEKKIRPLQQPENSSEAPQEEVLGILLRTAISW
ncbi:MAG: hypothetical protein HYX41_05480 [Bdellovibrio sp.]|nr:hypothetical protein [Bdellovibrio sp.]